MDFVLPSLDTIRAIFTDRQKINSTRALIVRNADTTYHYVNFEKPFRNRSKHSAYLRYSVQLVTNFTSV